MNSCFLSVPSLSVLRALLWEQWRISRLELLIRVVFAGGFLILISVAVAKADDTAIHVLRGILTFLIGFSALFSASWTSEFDSRQHGFTYRLGFARPISTKLLVFVPICYSLFWSLVFYLGGALAVFIPTGLALPLVGPSAIIACSVCMLIAGAWGPTHIGGRIVGMVGAVAATIGWLGLRDYWLDDPDPILLSIGKIGYFDLTWYEYLGLATVGSLSIVATIHSVELQRHGEAPFQSIFGSRRVLAPASAPYPTSAESRVPLDVSSLRVAQAPALCFSTALGAQIWYEIRRSAPLLLAACALVPAALFAFLCLNVHWEYAPRAWLGALVVVPIVFQLLGADSTLGLTHKQGLVRLSPFDATRPMRCDQLIGIKVMVVFGWSLCGFSLIVLFASLHALLSGESEYWLRDFRSIQGAVGNVPPVWWAVGMIDLLFIFLSSTTLLFAVALCVSRYPQVLVAGSLVFLAHVGIFAWDATNGWQWALLWKCYSYLLPMAVMVASMIALIVAIRAGYLGKLYFGIVLGVWLIYAASSVWLLANSPPSQSIPFVAYFIGLASLVLPLASAALAPLALAAHRHG
ncbi:MAG: hypothetical protein ABI557_04190 [Aureliella sp.]